MEKSESIINLVTATVAVMGEVKGVEKNLSVGSGNNTYKGVADQDVKKVIGESMAKNGLAIFPIGIDEITEVSVWDEVDTYSNATPKPMKRKQNVFTKVSTTYLLTHISGEWMEIKGFGHGIDTQDKSAGKATTYALKYALLYTFLVPTGKIDDADNTHSDDIKTPAPQPKAVELPWLNLLDKDGNTKPNVLANLEKFFGEGNTVDDLKTSVRVSAKDMEYITTKILGF